MVERSRWTHLIRFIAKEDGQVHLGQVDVDTNPDVGLAAFEGKDLAVQVISGSVYDGVVTSQTLHVAQVSTCYRIPCVDDDLQ